MVSQVCGVCCRHIGWVLPVCAMLSPGFLYVGCTFGNGGSVVYYIIRWRQRQAWLFFDAYKVGLKRSLVCIVKKSCLQCKEALFGDKRSLVWKGGKNGC